MYTDKFMTSRTIRNDKVVVDKLVEDNWNLVKFVYNKLLRKNKAIARYEDDILSAGYVGLWESALAFDATYIGPSGEHIRFSTYAVPNIKGRMLQYIKCSKNEVITDPEVIKISLDAPIDSAENIAGTTYGEIVAGIHNQENNDSFELEMFTAFLDEKILKPAEAQILKSTILDGERYVELGHKYGVSRQRIEQIRSNGIAKYKEWREQHISEYDGSRLLSSDDLYTPYIKGSEVITGLKLCKMLDLNTRAFYRLLSNGPAAVKFPLLETLRQKAIDVVVLGTVKNTQTRYTVTYAPGNGSMVMYEKQVIGKHVEYVRKWSI